MAKIKTDFTNIKCFRCGKNDLTSKSALKYKDDNWICNRCYHKIRTNRRIGNLNHNQSLGDNCEELTVLWRGVKNLNIENDNFTNGTPIDHSKDSELGIVQTKGRTYNSKYKKWTLSSLDREWFKDFDHLIVYCISENGKNIERIYIFPSWEIIERKSINIYNSYQSRCSWVEFYRIKEENILMKVNKIWNKIINGV